MPGTTTRASLAMGQRLVCGPRKRPEISILFPGVAGSGWLPHGSFPGPAICDNCGEIRL